MTDACKTGKGEVIYVSLSYCCNQWKVWHRAGYKLPRLPLQHRSRCLPIALFLPTYSQASHIQGLDE